MTNQAAPHSFARPTRILSAEDYTREETYRATRLPVNLASTIIPDAYRSQRFYEVEQDRLWSKSWVCVGYASQVGAPGEVLTATVAGQPFLVTRDRDGRLHAFYNVCRHRGSQLVCKDGVHDIIRCPYHGWGYALDGRLLGTPYFKGLDIPEEQRAAFDMSEAKEFCRDDYGLLRVRAETWGCFVFLNLDPDARPLAESLGDLPQRLARYPLAELKLVRRRPMEIQANWKLIAENFMEYYHLPWVHPELCNISGFNDHYRAQGPGLYTGMCTYPLSKDPHTANFELPAMKGLSPVEAQTAYWLLVFPNLALFLLPNHLFTLLFRPDGTGRSLETADLLVHPDVLTGPDAEKQVDAVFAFWDMVNQQDIHGVETVQKGVQATAYPGGRMCYRFEEPVHRFQNMVIDRMVGKHRIPAGDPQEDPGWIEALKADDPKAKPLVGSKRLKAATVANA